jgi:hypothetical protein
MTNLTAKDRTAVRRALRDLMVFSGRQFAGLVAEAHDQLSSGVPPLPPTTPAEFTRKKLRGIMMFAGPEFMSLLGETRRLLDNESGEVDASYRIAPKK